MPGSEDVPRRQVTPCAGARRDCGSVTHTLIVSPDSVSDDPKEDVIEATGADAAILEEATVPKPAADSFRNVRRVDSGGIFLFENLKCFGEYTIQSEAANTPPAQNTRRNERGCA